MPSSPRTPTRRRKSSNIDRQFPSPKSIEHSPLEKRLDRRYSVQSIPSSASIEEHSVAEDGSSVFAINILDSAANESNRLGSLADELAEAWDDGGGHGRDSEDVPIQEGMQGLADGQTDQRERPTFEIHRTLSNGVPNIPQREAKDDRSLSPPKQTTRSRVQRIPSNVSDYDGSDYGDTSDLETVQGISASLEHRLAAIESLARRGTESNGGGADNVIARVAECLRDLGSQAGMETGASRLTTAHTAISTDLAHQARLIQTLSHHFISPFSVPPSPDEIDGLLPQLTTTSGLLSQPNTRTVSALHGVHSLSIDLISTLSMLADSLHMIRQTTSRAARKLKAAKEAVDDVRKDYDLREDGIRWIQEGNWDEKLSNRECAKVCGHMLSGFKQACEEWEKRVDKKTVDHILLEVAAG
ncbi:MAG: hypothetical protein Q9218_000932 [Villophora microphyllina]